MSSLTKFFEDVGFNINSFLPIDDPNYRNNIIERTTTFKIFDESSKIVIAGEVAGFSNEEIDISVNNNIITIKGSCEKQKNKYLKHATFNVTYSLPSGLDLDKVSAINKNGFLTIEIPKVEQKESKIRKITVKY